MTCDIVDLYARCLASGFDHDGALSYVEAAIENELRAAVDTIKAGLSEDGPAK